jgi:hypothetical protein
MYQFTGRAIKLTVVIIEQYHCYQSHIKFHSNVVKSELHGAAEPFQRRNKSRGY